MKASKLYSIVFLTLLFSSMAAAQILGADMTVEESLVEFVSNILGFPVESAGEVVIYLIGPIIAFYFLINNFAREGYNNFQQRLERRDYLQTDEDLPTGMKLFSLVTSFLTVVTIGRIAPGLILLLGLLALILGIMMFAGLFNRESSGGTTDTTQTQDSDSASNGGSQDGDSDTSWMDVGEKAFELGSKASSGAKKWSEEKKQEQREEAFRYFENNFLNELEKLESDMENRIIPDLEDTQNQLENDDMGRGTFVAIKDLSGGLTKRLKDYRSLLNQDMNNGLTNYNNGNLQNKISNDIANDESPLDLVVNLNKKVESLIEEDRVQPPRDVFDDLHEDLQLILSVGHFMYYYPEYEKLSKSVDEAGKCFNIASSYGLAPSPIPPDHVQRLQNTATEGYKNEVFTVVKKAKKLSEHELSLTKDEINGIKLLNNKEGVAIRILESLINDMSSHYTTGLDPDHVNNLEGSKNSIENSLDRKVNRLKNRLGDSKEYETQVFKELKELEQKI